MEQSDITLKYTSYQNFSTFIVKVVMAEVDYQDEYDRELEKLKRDLSLICVSMLLLLFDDHFCLRILCI
jgi:hypothetical protein